MTDQPTETNPFGGISSALTNLVRAEISFGTNLLRSMTGLEVPNASDMLRTARARTAKSCCDVPPPCWMPQPLGECTSHVGACASACIRVVVTNCDRVARTVHVDTSPKGAKGVTVSPASLTLGPMERGTVSVCLTVPQDTSTGTRYETLVWVRGCKEHFLRWTVSVGTVGFDSCHEIAVDDCPDYRHHWYDHFYCARRCPTQGRTTDGAVTHG